MDEFEIKAVMEKAGCSREKAIQALQRSDGRVTLAASYASIGETNEEEELYGNP